MISPNSLFSTPSIKKVPFIGKTRDESSHIGGYHIVQRRVVTPEIGANPVVDVRSNDKSQEFIREVESNVSSTSGNNTSLMKDEPGITDIPRGIISDKRTYDLVSRYKVPLGYIYRIPFDDKYMSTPGLLEVDICEKVFWGGFHIPIHPFIKKLLNIYGLVPT